MHIPLFAGPVLPINYTTDAFNSLISLVNFIESKNTAGAGLLNRYEAFVQKEFFSPSKIKRFHNLMLNLLQLRCIDFNEWLIAFSVHEDFVLIEALVHKSRISD